MKHGIRILLGSFAMSIAPAVAVAQGNDSNTADPEGPGGSVQIGAGSTSSVTTGFSGPKGGAAKTAKPLPADMPWPARSGAFGAPGSIVIALPKSLRCSVIEDANARKRCEHTGASR